MTYVRLHLQVFNRSRAGELDFKFYYVVCTNSKLQPYFQIEEGRPRATPSAKASPNLSTRHKWPRFTRNGFPASFLIYQEVLVILSLGPISFSICLPNLLSVSVQVVQFLPWGEGNIINGPVEYDKVASSTPLPPAKLDSSTTTELSGRDHLRVKE
jgi:hypothetical protein